MPAKASSRTINVAQLVKNVREQIAQREQSGNPVSPAKENEPGISIPLQLAASLHSISNEIDALGSRIQVGEPRPAALSARRRFSHFLKDRLSRLLWWQTYQVRDLTALIARRNREESRLLETLLQSFQESQAQLRASREVIAELQQHLARLEYSKANRTEATAQSAHCDTLLAAKADRQEVSVLNDQIKVLEVNKAGQTELDAITSRLGEFDQFRGGLNWVVEKVKEIDQTRGELNAIEARVKECELSRVSPEQVASLSEDTHTTARQISTLRLDLQDFHRRLSVLVEQAKKRMPEPFSPEQVEAITVKGQDFLDSLYLAFEDRFRGGFEGIQSGLKIYLPYLREAATRTNNAPVLDVACGRGEWLDLLRTNGIQARGVDLNGAAIELCRQQGLEVTLEDAFSYLSKQTKNSFSALTAFHFIEHVDHRAWIALLDEALRILKPGGVAILETPNARNILTTAGDFYRDPTHNRPVFPETIEAIGELRGFFDSKVYCFNADRSALTPLSEHRFDTLEDYVSVSRDAVWIGIKA